MDKTLKYIMMCAKAPELQKKNVNPSEYAIYAYKDQSEYRIGYLRNNQSWEEHFIWLPRAEQLQDMFYETEKTETYRMPRALAIRYVLHEFKEYVCGLQRNYMRQFDSDEQLWLAYMMEKKCNKIWNDNKCEWEEKFK